jgi:hypothetical protein
MGIAKAVASTFRKAGSPKNRFQPYRNTSGKSGVSMYLIEPEAITVRFTTGAVYRYTYDSAGRGRIEQMKVLATNGQWLNSFINLNVKFMYESKG